jgi:hypothetical protein
LAVKALASNAAPVPKEKSVLIAVENKGKKANFEAT